MTMIECCRRAKRRNLPVPQKGSLRTIRNEWQVVGGMQVKNMRVSTQGRNGHEVTIASARDAKKRGNMDE